MKKVSQFLNSVEKYNDNDANVNDVVIKDFNEVERNTFTSALNDKSNSKFKYN